MADYTTITDSQVDPDAPITSELGYAWSYNPVAIAEGAINAPRMQMAAFPRLLPGASVRFKREMSSAGPNVTLFFPFVQFGTIRFSLGPGNGGGIVTIVRRRADIGLTQYSGVAITPATTDIDVIPGDLVTVQLTAPSSSGVTVSVLTDGRDIIPCGGDWCGYMTTNPLP